MDEKEVLANAAAELTREGDVDEAVASLERERAEAFPLLLFMANVANDVIVDPIATFANLTGFGWVFYMILVWTPLFGANFVYLWGKVGFWRKKGWKLAFKMVRNWTVKRLVVMGVAGAVPFVGLLFPQCIFILIAHNRHKRLVKEMMAIVDIFAQVARGDVTGARTASYEYAERLTGEIVRAANISGRVGDRFGERARAGAQRLESNIVREARGTGGRAITRMAIQAQRQDQQASRIKRQEARRIASTPTGSGNSSAPIPPRVP